MKNKINLGLGLSLGAMVVFVTGIKALVDMSENKHESKVRIAEIEAGANRKATNNNTKKKTNKK